MTKEEFLPLQRLNSILFLADFLSLKQEYTPVTDNCKYYFIFSSPINSSYIAGSSPNYDKNNKYVAQAVKEYELLVNKFGEEYAASYIDDICWVKARGTVDAKQMLQYITYYSSKQQKKAAYIAYNTWKKNQKYTHKTINDDGNIEERECTRYVYNSEKSSKFNKISKGCEVYDGTIEENIKNNK